MSRPGADGTWKDNLACNTADRAVLGGDRAVAAYHLARQAEFGDYIPPSTSVVMERASELIRRFRVR
jgi:hypothetical protein